MPSVAKLPAAIFLFGATATGKSALAIALARCLDGEIISVDSAMVYKGLDIGTAKPSQVDRAAVRHHLIDLITPDLSYSAGEFRQAALAVLADICRRGKTPILTGGTMLYFHSLLKGLARLPPADSAIRSRLHQQLQEFGSQVLHQRLQKIDPQTAGKIHPNDPQRIQRALEVYEISGKPISYFFAQADPEPLPYRPLKCILQLANRQDLHAKIAARFQQMLAQGLVEEVQNLRDSRQLQQGMPALQAVGYRQTWQYLHGHCTLAEMSEKAIIASRQLAKRQLTWLRRETDCINIDASQNNLAPQVIKQLAPLL